MGAFPGSEASCYGFAYEAFGTIYCLHLCCKREPSWERAAGAGHCLQAIAMTRAPLQPEDGGERGRKQMAEE